VGVVTALTDELSELVAQRFRVLSEPARLRLLDILRGGPSTVGDLAVRTGLSQQNTSKHLGVLHTAGLVRRNRVGTTARYEIADRTVFDLCELVCDALRDHYAKLQASLPGPPP
jgi:DNA-binding transcriptional ArsR family regulator